MKLIISIWLLSAGLLPQQKPEIYHVVHVKGEVINKKSNQVIKLSDQLKASDELIYKTPDARLIVYSTSKGRFVLDKASSEHAAQPEAPISAYWEFVKDLFMPASAIEPLSTRTVEEKGVGNLEVFFGINTFVFLGDSYKLKVNASNYPMTGGKYFVYKYAYTGTEYSKRIDYRGDTLIFNKKSLYTVKGNFINPEEAGKVDIYYFNAKTSPEKIVSLLPVFIPEDELKAELSAMLAILKEENLSREQVLTKLYEHIVLVYGNTNRQMLEEWVTQHFTI